jgi:hypothetical protein
LVRLLGPESRSRRDDPALFRVNARKREIALGFSSLPCGFTIVEMRRLLSAFLTALSLWRRGVPRDGIRLRRIACLMDTVRK